MLKNSVLAGTLVLLNAASALQAQTPSQPQISPLPQIKVPAQNGEASPAMALETHEELNAAAWVQSSAEAKIASRQAYHLAARQLDAALRDKNWSAALEQTAPFKKLPPAIIVDLDETVLDNSFYFARLARDHAIYSDEGWNLWSAQADAGAIEGAAEFLQYAARKGVQIFYVSNRTREEEAGTRANLQRLGCPLQGPEDHVLLIGEKTAWTSNKTTRRSFVAQNHRILLVIGDDLNDFVSARGATLAQRSDLYNKYIERWGERWILLSNPLYGSWEDAINGFDHDISRQEMLRRKFGVLQYRDPVRPSPSSVNALAIP